MRNLHAPALILDVVDLQERDRIVTFLTAEHGKKRGVARGARAKYSRFAGQLQPLAKVQVGWFEKDGRDLVRIGDVSLVRPAADLQGDLEGILVGSYLAEHMMEFAQENEDSHRLFRLLDTTVEALAGGLDRSLGMRYLEIWTLRLAGVFPTPRDCPLCDKPLVERAVLAADDGALLCPDCATRDAAGGRFEVGAGVLDLLRRSAREDLASLSRSRPNAGVLERVEELCARVRRAFLQYELKSYKVMRRTLADGLDGIPGGI